MKDLRRIGARACVTLLAAIAGSVCVLPASAGQATAAQPAAETASQDDDVTLALFLRRLEPIVLNADVEGFAALEGPLGDREEALAFARGELRSGATRVVLQERDRQELTLAGIPGGGYGLTIDAFIEYGNQARVATWQFYVRKSGDSWALIRQQVVSSVDNLFRLTLNTAKQFDVRNLVIESEDLALTLPEGSVFTIETDRGVTGLVVMGRGDMRFAPAPDTEKGQVRILSGSEVLESRFDAAYVRVGNSGSHYNQDALTERPVDARELKRAQQIFKEESSKSFAVDLADLTRDAWTLLPGYDDFLAEVRTRKFNTLTYARSASEPEDISVFERKRKRNIALYASREKLETRGRFYNEDDLTAIDVLDYDIDVTALPNRYWIEGRARMRLRARSSLGQLTLKLADSLVVRSMLSDRFGRLFNLRVTDQNTVLVNLPTVLPADEELTLTVTYAGRLDPQSPDRETLAVGQDEPGFSPPQSFPDDFSIARAEPSFLYSNRSYWYPQSPVTDYATARIRLTIPIEYGCVATGELTREPELVAGRSALDARRTYTFAAPRPARYLSFIVSRFIRAQQTTVDFTTADGGQGSAGTSSVAASSDPLPSAQLTIEANPRTTRSSKPLVDRAADIMRFYQSLVSDAPYPSFTIALVENLLPGGHSPAYFAQLNQPLPNSPLVWRNDPAAFDNYPEFFTAHEIAHQWWGHGVGWQNYHDQWLSEGFAQYFAALYADRFRGDEVFQGVLRRMRRWAINESDQGPVHLGYRVGHIKNDGRAFRAIVYNKAAMVLHMLRQTIGDDLFFQGVRTFYLGSRFRKVGSEDFRASMELTSGRDLRRFFERWIYNATLPRLAFSYRVDTKDGVQSAILRVEQTGEVFDVPVLVTLEYADGRTRDVTVLANDKVTEMPIRLESPLRTATVSKRDVSLAQFD